MSTFAEITYEPYNKNSLIVHGADKLKHRSVFRSIDGRWNSRLRQGPAWLIPRAEENSLIQVINQLNKQHELVEMKTHAKSRKEQHKYHRAISESEYSSDGSNHSGNHQDDLTGISRTDMDKYCRKFKKTPDTFKTPEYVYEQHESTNSVSGSSKESDTERHRYSDDASFSECSEEDKFPEPNHEYKNYKASPSPSLSPPPPSSHQYQKPKIAAVADKYREPEKTSSHKPRIRAVNAPHSSTSTRDPRSSTSTRDRRSSTSAREHRRPKELSSHRYEEQTTKTRNAPVSSSHRHREDTHPYSRREREYYAPPKRAKESSHHHRRYRHYVSSDESEEEGALDSRELRELKEQMREIQLRMSKVTSSSSQKKHRRR